MLSRNLCSLEIGTQFPDSGYAQRSTISRLRKFLDYTEHII